MKKAKLSLLLMSSIIVGGACTKNCKGKGTEPVEQKEAPKEAPVDKAKEGALDHKEAQELAANAQEIKGNSEMDELVKEFDLKPGEKLYATFDTSMGPIKAELFWDKTPVTVLNFVQLALGKKEWSDPSTKEKKNSPLYNGTKFHRVIKNFMIQGGDPMGTGFGGPGYQFKDEFNSALKHDKKGILSMANSGPNTNGSQFFITEVPTPHLDGRHTVFGQVTDSASLDIITQIANVQTDVRDKPVTDIVIKTLSVQKGNA